MNFRYLACLLAFTPSLMALGAVADKEKVSERSVETGGTSGEDQAPGGFLEGESAFDPAQELSQSSIVGSIDIRPTYSFSSKVFNTQNMVSLGYKFNPMFKLAFHQQINANIQDPSNPNMGIKPSMELGFIQAAFSNIWQSPDKTWSLNYDARFYIPETRAEWDSRRWGQIRNYFNLKKSVTSFYNVTFMEIPVFYIYGAPGIMAGTAPNQVAKPNQFFENRFYIFNEFKMGKFTFTLPILLISTNKFDYGGKKGGFSNNLWFWPELAYSLDDKTDVGVSLYTDNVIAPDFSSFNFFGKTGGVSQSVAQVLFRTAL